MNGEKGQALPLVLLALGIGTLVIAPFLGHASSNLIGSRIYGQAITEQYSCDAGVEHAIWSLTNGDLAAQLPSPGDSTSYQLSETVNGVSPSITVTTKVAWNGQSIGSITDTVIGTLEFDTSEAREPDTIHVSGNVYAIVYRGPGNDGFLKTVQIVTDGTITDTVIGTLEFDATEAREPNIVHVSCDIYAIAYRGSGRDGFLKTVQIVTDGTITDTVIGTLEFDATEAREPDTIHVSGDVYAIAYRGPGRDGFLKTAQISDNGTIGDTVIDTLEFDTSEGREPDIIHVSGDVYAIAYRGPGSDGFLKTVQTSDNGTIGDTVIDTLEFDTNQGIEPDIIHISGNVYAIVYRGPGNDGFLETVEIATNGQITDTVIGTLEFDTARGVEPDIIHVSGNVYAIAYGSSGEHGFLNTVEIETDGTITDTVIDILEFDESAAYDPSIIHVSGDVFAIAYRGPDEDGFLKTVEIAAGIFIYEIVSTTSENTIRAVVKIVDETVSILSWQVE